MVALAAAAFVAAAQPAPQDAVRTSQASAPTPAGDPTPVDEVVVTKLRQITYSYTSRLGRLVRWRVVRSTGEPQLDRLVERYVRRCAAETPADAQAIPACVERLRPELRADALRIEADLQVRRRP